MMVKDGSTYMIERQIISSRRVLVGMGRILSGRNVKEEKHLHRWFNE